MPHSIESLFLGWVFAIYETIGWVGVGLLMFVESTGVPFPSELIMPVAVWVLISAQGKGLGWVLLAGLYQVSLPDWPQFLGPNRDGVYSGSDITEAEPELIWKKNIGEGK